jgi:hypothetical protein
VAQYKSVLALEIVMPDSSLPQKDLNVIREAAICLEAPSLLMKLANLAGVPAAKRLGVCPRIRILPHTHSYLGIE